MCVCVCVCVCPALSQPPAKRSTAEIMKVLENKVAVHGSAEKVFRVLDTNLNGYLEVHEIADAIRPYLIDIQPGQAEEVLAEINRISGAKVSAEAHARAAPRPRTAASTTCPRP